MTHRLRTLLLRPTWLLALLAVCTALQAQHTQVQYLSGTGPHDAVPWQFFCTEGRNSGRWTTIPVPSNWEFHGFGTYNYGHDKNKGKEEGLYRHRFQLPATAKGHAISLVFEGSMTDTHVKVNGQSAGPVHQGGFYRFAYDITRLVKPGADNLLEVRVAKQSADPSVNRAEREADYWIFGGIYRPVYLRILPKAHVQRLAIDARANGQWRLQAYTAGIAQGMQLRAQVYTLSGQAVGQAASTRLQPTDTMASLQAVVPNAIPWHAEAPHLYKMRVQLLDAGGTLLHETEEKIGFRSIELRSNDGIYINGTKVILKGVNRHCTWPTTGKALTYAQSLQDALLIKQMNMNAVRMSHYPPDKHFLDICDSLGLYVLNELAGWQKSYDTAVGKRLVKELVIRDVNHPSILLWANGNEGGWNKGLLPEYGRWDIQQREVYLPWERHGKLETKHYPDYNYVQNSLLYDRHIFMPTEFMHGLYDGGHGAGLEDFWNTMLQKPNLGGGFLWVLADEGIVRTDKNDSMDAKGNQGADGIVGPFREKEGSFYTIRQLWSPVQVTAPTIGAGFDGRLLLQNRYHFTNLQQCRFGWKLLMPNGDTLRGHLPGMALEPGAQGWLQLGLPGSWQQAQVLYFTASDANGQELCTWSWPLQTPLQMLQQQGPAISKNATAATYSYSQQLLEVKMDHVRLLFDTSSGLLAAVYKGDTLLPLSRGPQLAQTSLQKTRWQLQPTDTALHLQVLHTGDATLQVHWTFASGKPVRLQYSYVQPADADVRGLHFSFPDSLVRAVDYFGMGPYRVWKNRLKGGTHGHWHKTYNDAITGERWQYPEFKGFHAGVYYTRLHTHAGSFAVYSAADPYFLQLLKPTAPAGAYNQHTAPPFAEGELGFLQAISPIGTKFQPAAAMGPQSQKNSMLATWPLGKEARNAPDKLPHFTPVSGELWFDFR
ncbi:MAG: glycoside hydrolase family 2 [Chitinophagaceae bacterium]|nr:glycoside hydrolase family 2 [Chitinophagaceae bacterium]